MDLKLLVCLWVIQGIVAAHIARKKGRNPYLWFPIGCFFGVFGIFGIVLMKSNTPGLTKVDAPVRRLPHFLWYYLDEHSKQQGPVSTNALESELRQGKVSLATYVWREGMAEWQRLEQVFREFQYSQPIPG